MATRLGCGSAIGRPMDSWETGVEEWHVEEATENPQASASGKQEGHCQTEEIQRRKAWWICGTPKARRGSYKPSDAKARKPLAKCSTI